MVKKTIFLKRARAGADSRTSIRMHRKSAKAQMLAAASTTAAITHHTTDESRKDETRLVLFQ